jgi:UDP-glucose 4-epimerase
MRYVITGGSGYIGTRLVEHLCGREDTERIVVCDLNPPRVMRPKVEFERLDVRDREAARSVLQRVKPDALVHLAFILNPSHDEDLMYEVDVNGTRNVLEAASLAGTQQVLVASSSTAYGAFADNPEPITEEQPVRGVAGFSYARDKTESDRLCQLWALEHPDRTMTIVRPCIVFGPSVDNYLVRLWTNAPFQPDAGTLDNTIQFVHEDDVVDAMITLLHGRHAGAYNVAGDGLMTLRECAELIASPIRKMPMALYRLLGRIFWALRMGEAPPGQIEFAIHPWIVSNEKLKATGWTPRYDSRETFEITMRAHGKLPPAAPSPPASSGNGDQEPVATLAAEDSPGP